jgi:spore germination protein
MQIHVVKPGETLYSISSMYSIDMNDLIISNEIPNPDDLVIGQTIVIPIWGSYYVVKPNDTLYSISNSLKIPVAQLINANNITNSDLIVPGMRLYIPQKFRTKIDSGAYIDTDITGEASEEEAANVGDLLTTIQLFSYQVNSLGELKPPQFEEDVIQAAIETSTIPILVLTNIEDGQFSTEAATAIFNSEVLQNSILDEVIAIMKEKGYKGLDIDFEYLGAENREKYNRFLAKARSKVDEYGYTLSTAIAPKIAEDQTGVLYEGHDYEFHGKINDFVNIMTYEWGYVAGPPRAVAPIDEVEKVMDYALTKISPDKLMMGIPLYGYDWTLPFVKGESRAKPISSQEAIELAAEYGAEIDFDPESASPYFVYVDEEGKEHEVWFEDARSIQAKFDLVKSVGIRGFFYWVLGRDFPQNWLLIEDNFIVK